MAEIEVVHWNPPKTPGKLGKLLSPLTGRIDNFGDLLGPEIVDRLTRHLGVDVRGATQSSRLLVVGSIMKLARPGDVVWGTGVNGKSVDNDADFSNVDVRAVRGPLTAQWLRERGARVPDVFGDPGLLVSLLWPNERPRTVVRDFVIVPNIHDAHRFRKNPNAISPRAPFAKIRDRILAADFVVGSSLHGIVVAESYGIPARLIRSGTEPAFKYEDYYLGSGRSGFKPAENLAGALDAGGEPLPSWDAQALINAFPVDLWSALSDSGR